MDNYLTGNISVMNRIAQSVLLCVLGISLVSAEPSRLYAEEQPAKPKGEELAQQIEGTWVYAGKPGEPNAPTVGLRLKTMRHGLYKVSQFDPNTRAEIYHHGGTYTLSGDQYAEHVTYSSEDRPELVKQTFRFTIKIEGDTLTQTGVGNPWTEVWKRVKQPPKKE
ncbi:hypothetical protein ACXR0O_03460 [Verrucomicrobiota bacterium sgz303538]